MIAEGLIDHAAGVAAARASVSRRVLQATGWLVAAGVAVKSAALVKEIVVAAAYGRSDAMDAFLAAFLIPTLLINIVAESLNQALVPVIVRVRLCEGAGPARRLFSNAVSAAGVMLAGAAAVIALTARMLLPLVASNFSPSKLELALQLFYVLLPCLALGGMASLFSAVLNTAEKFVLPALAPILISFTIVTSTVSLRGSLGIWALALGTLAGTGFQALLLGAATHANGYPVRPRWHGADAATREVASRFWPLLLSAVLACGGLLVDQAMAAMLPPGSVSGLVFAGRFVSVSLALIAGAISTALGPALSALVAQRDWIACRAAVRSWSIRSAAISVPLAVVLMAGAPLIVRLTLQHGAFGANDSSVVAPVLAMSAIQIPFFVVSRVFYRFIVAMGRNDLIFYCGAINLALDIVLNIVLMRIMDVAGIALATSLWTVATFGFLWYWSAKLLASSSEAQA
jgi:putative peptidoglycan lipid II flippase